MTNQITTAEAAQADAVREPVARPDKYQRNIAAGLSRVFDDDGIEEQVLDFETARVVIFSDHHKGGRDGADDFRGCERAYAAALAYYLENDYRLLAVGDVEELWECTPKEVLAAYKETLELEGQFHAAKRYERFFGNHDNQWSSEKEVSGHLEKFFPGLRVRQALKLRVVRDGDTLGVLFVVHGHQGTLDSDRWAWLSRPVVRHVWRPLQRKLNMRSTPPSRDFDLRARHDAAMFSWARTHPKKPVLIAGHTHRPVFWTSKPAPKPSEADVLRELEELRSKTDGKTEEIAKLRAKLEFVRADSREKGPPSLVFDPPCYFNTGCCSFGDGDITGLEIAGGSIRLVRWPDDDDKPLPKLLVEADFAEVLSRVATGAPTGG